MHRGNNALSLQLACADSLTRVLTINLKYDYCSMGVLAMTSIVCAHTRRILKTQYTERRKDKQPTDNSGELMDGTQCYNGSFHPFQISQPGPF